MFSYYIKNPWGVVRCLGFQERIRWFPDKLYLKCVYRDLFGVKLNLKEPRRFTEKMQWLKLYNRNIMYTNLVDKCEVKQIVSNIIGEEYMIPTLGVYDSFEHINFEVLPNHFVLKCTHDSGGVIVCNKDNLNLNVIKQKIEKSFNRNYFYKGREWVYKDIKPRIIAEQYIDNSEELLDYKLWCFNGIMYCCELCTSRYSKSGTQISFYNKEWELLEFKQKNSLVSKNIDRPQKYGEIINLAEKLAKNIPFVRVDFYIVNNKIYFGEMTFYPSAGFARFYPDKYDYILGEKIKLPM